MAAVLYTGFRTGFFGGGGGGGNDLVFVLSCCISYYIILFKILGGGGGGGDPGAHVHVKTRRLKTPEKLTNIHGEKGAACCFKQDLNKQRHTDGPDIVGYSAKVVAG